MKVFQTIKSNDYVPDRIQDNLRTFFNQLGGLYILDGLLFENITINTSYKLAHKLNRKPNGYIVTKRSSNATVYNGTIDSTFLNLNSSGNVTVDIWVF